MSGDNLTCDYYESVAWDLGDSHERWSEWASSGESDRDDWRQCVRPLEDEEPSYESEYLRIMRSFTKELEPITISCAPCGHSFTTATSWFVVWEVQEKRMRDIKHRLICSKCGSRAFRMNGFPRVVFC